METVYLAINQAWYDSLTSVRKSWVRLVDPKLKINELGPGFLWEDPGAVRYYVVGSYFFDPVCESELAAFGTNDVQTFERLEERLGAGPPLPTKDGQVDREQTHVEILAALRNPVNVLVDYVKESLPASWQAEVLDPQNTPASRMLMFNSEREMSDWTKLDV